MPRKVPREKILLHKKVRNVDNPGSVELPFVLKMSGLGNRSGFSKIDGESKEKLTDIGLAVDFHKMLGKFLLDGIQDIGLLRLPIRINQLL